jgi:diguanylate cyclase (GGDEF)-like protein/PAS domain S-box-containing protein
LATWSRRLSAAQNRPTGHTGAPRKEREDLPDTLPPGIDPLDEEAVRALLTMARDRPGFETVVTVRVHTNGTIDDVEILIAYDDDGPTAQPLDEDYEIVDGPEVLDDDADSVNEVELPLVEEMSGDRVIEMLTDTLVVTSDIVAIFASVGAEAIWANDAFATAIPIRESDKIWLIELLDEWSKGHFEVNVLPALVQHGRWNGRLTLQAGDQALPVSASLVAHRDGLGEIEAVSLVARDMRPVQAAEERARQSETRLAALVENAADIIVVVDYDAKVLYASGATTRLLGLEEGELAGTPILDRVHPDDLAKCDFKQLAMPDQDGLPSTAELRLAHADGGWRHFELVATDLSENPAIEGVVLNARDITDRVEAVARLADRAYTDPLTQLPNRMRLIDRLATLLDTARDKAVVAALYDIDRFKAFNESLGHAAGDELLRQVAHRLSDEVAAGDIVARLGGNEFAVIMPSTDDIDEALAEAERVRGRLSEPYQIGSETPEITLSVGISLSHELQSPEDLISDADTAVGIAKESGGDRVELLTSELRSGAKRRVHIEQLLRRALDADGGVQVHYQPIFDIRSGRVVSAEALLRVHDEEGELLSPAAFLEAAESTGLISPLTFQVLVDTSIQLAAWNAEADPNTPQEISVNVSPRQLEDPSFPPAVEEALDTSGVAPERLCLELTESMFISQGGDIDKTVEALRSIGMRIGLDDFGAGQSSLGYLRRFPLDFVKIDRGLIAGLGVDQEDTAIVRATIELGHSLNLLVVAVGVETEEQLEFLRMLECDRAQGFFYLPAVPADEFAERVAERVAQ